MCFLVTGAWTRRDLLVSGRVFLWQTLPPACGQMTTFDNKNGYITLSGAKACIRKQEKNPCGLSFSHVIVCHSPKSFIKHITIVFLTATSIHPFPQNDSIVKIKTSMFNKHLNHLPKLRFAWNLKHLFINGCFNWMISNLYIGNGWKSPFPSI